MSKLLLHSGYFAFLSTSNVSCSITAKDADSCLIDKNNKVFGDENKYVCDGSMISAVPGVIPELRTSAIRERAKGLIPDKVINLSYL